MNNVQKKNEIIFCFRVQLLHFVYVTMVKVRIGRITSYLPRESWLVQWCPSTSPLPNIADVPLSNKQTNKQTNKSLPPFAAKAISWNVKGALFDSGELIHPPGVATMHPPYIPLVSS